MVVVSGGEFFGSGVLSRDGDVPPGFELGCEVGGGFRVGLGACTLLAGFAAAVDVEI
jgi:hypothetical protein